MESRFWFVTVLALAGVWYAFAFSGARQIVVEVEPEAVADEFEALALRARDAADDGKPLTAGDVREIVRAWAVQNAAVEYRVNVMSDGETWTASAMPAQAVRDATSWSDALLHLRRRCEHWPSYKVDSNEKRVHNSNGVSLSASLALMEVKNVQVERRVEASRVPGGFSPRLRLSGASR